MIILEQMPWPDLSAARVVQAPASPAEGERKRGRGKPEDERRRPEPKPVMPPEGVAEARAPEEVAQLCDASVLPIKPTIQAQTAGHAKAAAPPPRGRVAGSPRGPEVGRQPRKRNQIDIEVLTW